MLLALREAASRPGADPALVERARALFSGDAVTVGNFCGNDEDSTTPGKTGLPGVRRVPVLTRVRGAVRQLVGH